MNPYCLGGCISILNILVLPFWGPVYLCILVKEKLKQKFSSKKTVETPNKKLE